MQSGSLKESQGPGGAHKSQPLLLSRDHLVRYIEPSSRVCSLPLCADPAHLCLPQDSFSYCDCLTQGGPQGWLLEKTTSEEVGSVLNWRISENKSQAASSEDRFPHHSAQGYTTLNHSVHFPCWRQAPPPPSCTSAVSCPCHNLFEGSRPFSLNSLHHPIFTSHQTLVKEPGGQAADGCPQRCQHAVFRKESDV